MHSIIYYFTGSGNSLVVARDLAVATGGEVASIAAELQRAPEQPIVPPADAVGLAFPVYYANMGGSGMPGIVERFVARLTWGPRYAFAIVAHAGAPEVTLSHLARRVASAGGTLAAGWTVQLAHSYPTGDKLRHMLTGKPLQINAAAEAERRRGLWTVWQIRVPAMAQAIRTRTAVSSTEGGPGALRRMLLALQRQMALARFRRLAETSQGDLTSLIRRSDAAFVVSARCNGCGTCSRVCPVGNITLVAGRPQWHHRCETCYACYQWCSREAIGGAAVEFEKRYHHPQVRLADVLLR